MVILFGAEHLSEKLGILRALFVVVFFGADKMW